MDKKICHDALPDPQCIIYKACTNLITGEVEIVYETNDSGRMLLEIYRCDGQMVKTIHSVYEHRGVHKVFWDGKDNFDQSVQNGVYTCQLFTKGASVSKQFILAK